MKHSYLIVVIFLASCMVQESEISPPTSPPEKTYRLDQSETWFPYEVGNYWINQEFIPCNNKTKEWYWEVVDLIETDSNNFFLLEKHLNPCDTTDYYFYRDWYAYTNDDKLYLSNSDFEYVRLEADFRLSIDESYIAQGLRYTVSEKSKTWMVFEYDLYDDGTYTRRWIKGLGRELHWDKAKISGIEYQQGIDF